MTDDTDNLNKAIKEVERARAVIAKLRKDIDDEKTFSQELISERIKLYKRIDEFEHILQPRLKSLLTFRAVRYVLKKRHSIKAAMGEKLTSKHLAHSITEPASPAKPSDFVLAIKNQVQQRSITQISNSVNDLPIALFAHDRADCVVNILEALALQGGLSNLHVWIDGDQGKPDKRAAINFVHDCVKEFPVKAIHRNRGNFGMRKMMILAMKYMIERYERVLFLEDDCFPTQNAIAGFSKALDDMQDDPSIFSVYGHPFLVEGEEMGISRFQGWGWATTAEKLRPLWRKLLDCYLMTEEEYLAFVDQNLTPDIKKKINVTPDRQPTDTIEKFFAWDETLGLLAALDGRRHRRTEERLIYNFGAGRQAAHFAKLEQYRKPPFNMVSIDEIWDYY